MDLGVLLETDVVWREYLLEPVVIAAGIAAVVGILTLVATVISHIRTIKHQNKLSKAQLLAQETLAATQLTAQQAQWDEEKLRSSRVEFWGKMKDSWEHLHHKDKFLRVAGLSMMEELMVQPWVTKEDRAYARAEADRYAKR